MTTKSRGRLIFLKYFTVSTLTITVLAVFVLRLIMPTDESLPDLLTRMFQGLTDNSVFLLVQILVTLFGVWALGGLLTDQIQKGKNFFITAGLAFLTLWLILFISSTLTASTLDAVEMGNMYFRTTFGRWTRYHLMPFVKIGIAYGLCFGFFMGKDIKTRVAY
jgi:hypothetical protein